MPPLVQITSMTRSGRSFDWSAPEPELAIAPARHEQRTLWIDDGVRQETDPAAIGLKQARGLAVPEPSDAIVPHRDDSRRDVARREHALDVALQLRDEPVAIEIPQDGRRGLAGVARDRDQAVAIRRRAQHPYPARHRQVREHCNVIRVDDPEVLARVDRDESAVHQEACGVDPAR